LEPKVLFEIALADKVNQTLLSASQKGSKKKSIKIHIKNAFMKLKYCSMKQQE